MTATFGYPVYKLAHHHKREILDALGNVQQPDCLLASIEAAIGEWLALSDEQNKATLFPRRSETAKQLGDVHAAALELKTRLDSLNTDAYWELKLHAGEPARPVRYPADLRAFASALDWLIGAAERGAERYAQATRRGRRKEDAPRVLVERLMAIYPGGGSARGFHKFVSAVFEVCSITTKVDDALRDVRAALAGDCAGAVPISTTQEELL